jgi:hypothetical protein
VGSLLRKRVQYPVACRVSLFITQGIEPTLNNAALAAGHIFGYYIIKKIHVLLRIYEKYGFAETIVELCAAPG